MGSVEQRYGTPWLSFVIPMVSGRILASERSRVLQKLGATRRSCRGARMPIPLSFANDPVGRFKVMPFGFPDTLPRLVQYVSGIERCKMMVRGSDPLHAQLDLG